MTHAIVTGDKSLITEGAGKALYTFPITGAPASQYMPVTTLADESGNTVDYATTTPGTTAVGVVTRIAGTAKVDGSAVTQPVSLASLPALVAGSATIGAVKVTDGTNVAAVKPSGFSAISTDPSLVVTISPNNAGSVGVIDSASRTLSLVAGPPSTALSNALNYVPVVSGGYVFDAAQPTNKFVPMQGDTTTGVWVNVKNATMPSTPVTGTFWQTTQPVSIATMPSTPVTGTFWQATQPVSLASLPALVTGSAVIGAVKMVDAGGVNTATVKAASTLAVATDTAQVVAVRDTITNNLTQVSGTSLTLATLPTGADGQSSLPVSINSIQKLTYDVASRNLVSGALTANTAKAVLSFEHAATSTKTVRIRRISVHAIQTTALSGSFDLQITRGTAASTAGTNNTPVPRKTGDAAAECLVRTLPTIVAATVGDSLPAGGFATTTTLYSPPVLVFDWQEGGEMKPYILRAGVLESFVINIISTAAHNLTLTISVDFTEE